MKRGMVGLLCALALCLGVSAPAFAEGEASARIIETGIEADGVANYEGYGSLTVDPVYADPEQQYPLTSNPRAALIGRDGNFVFPYKDTFLSYRVYDGVVSLVGQSAYLHNNIKEWAVDEGVDWVGFYGLDGTPIAPGRYFGASPMIGGYALVTEYDNVYGSPMKASIIDRSGNVTANLPGKFAEMASFGEGPYSCGISGFADGGFCSEGLLNCWSYATVEDCWNGIFDSFFYVDMNGNTKFELSADEYSDCYPFFEGRAGVQSKATGKYGYIDTDGELVIPCTFDTYSPFHDGVAAVSVDGRYGYIDKLGNNVVPFSFDGAFGAGDGLYSASKDGKWGLVDADGRVMVPFEYDDISSYEGGVAYAIKDGKVSIITDVSTTPHFTVTFDANGWGTAPASEFVGEGEPATEPAAPTAIGYAFGGWYGDRACTEAYDFSQPVTADVTVYAKWTRNQPANGGEEIYRMYNQYTREHLYTNDPAEANALRDGGWDYENVGWVAPSTSEKPIYRLFNEWSKEHLYTTSKNEYDTLSDAGWSGEGIKFYSADETGQPAWRVRNPWEDGPSSHLYTTDANEYASLLRDGCEDEGICWYGLK